jgi:uncharacterized protein (TIGR03067 family)
MKRWLITALAVSLLPTSGAPAKVPPANKTELEGEWALVVWESEGYWFTAEDGIIGDHYRDLRFTFTADRFRTKLREKGQSLGWLGWDGFDDPYKIDRTKDPKEIDLENLGRGIYVVRGDRLFMALYRGKEAKRPTAFDLKRGASMILLLERMKK